MLVDFGKELHGGVHLASGGPSKKGMKVRVRFGESATEAMAEAGYKAAESLAKAHCVAAGDLHPDLHRIDRETAVVGGHGFRRVDYPVEHGLTSDVNAG